MKEVQKKGRIQYVEPNNFNIENNNINVFGDNITIPHPYEDLSIAVDLEVLIADRKSCGVENGTNNIDNRISYNFSSLNGTISFMGGTNGVLTTNYTDISMTDPKGNTKECLGIESIHIAYDSWMYPQVTIKFVDVRGASLFLKSEQNYYNNEDIKDVIGSNFYRSLFMFPHPLFKLKVKGF